jgi:hypothetical protein
MACLTVPYVSQLYHKRHVFREKRHLTFHACCDVPRNLCLSVFSFHVELDARSQPYVALHVKCVILFFLFYTNFEVLERFLGNRLYKMPLKSVHKKSSCIVRTDGRADGHIEYDEANALKVKSNSVITS